MATLPTGEGMTFSAVGGKLSWDDWLRLTLSSIGDGVIGVDRDDRVIFLNPVAEALTGWAAADAAGVVLKEVFRVIDESTQRPLEPPARGVVERGLPKAPVLPALLIGRDGGERPIDHDAVVIRDDRGEALGAAYIFRDTTGRRRAERALHESEERFRLLVEGAKDYAIFGLDPSGRVTTWNAGAEHLNGYRIEEIVGGHLRRFYTAEDVERGGPEEQLATAAEVGRAAAEGWRVRKDGSRFWASVVLSALRDRDGALGGFIKVTRDVTERMRLEDELRLRADQLAEADRLKDEFLAILSHELRNPLGTLLNAVQLFHLAKEVDPVQEKAKVIVERQVGRLIHFVDDLLESTRIATGAVVLRLERCDAGEIVRRSAEGLAHAAATQGHRLSVTIPPAPIWLAADPARVEQMVNNLLGNAIKYTDDGGRIDVSAAQEGSELVLRVRDSGIGITPDLLPRVFELFTQADRSLVRSQGGLGIGLTIVQRLAKLHHGTVEAASGGLGLGSEFVVRLPTEGVPSLGGGAIAAPPPLRVLVVDDNVDYADGISLLLQYAGYRVEVAHSGPEALRTVAETRPDVVVLDIGLPGMDGYEVARRFRLDPAFEKLRVVGVSGYRKEEGPLGRGARFDDYLMKPIRLAKLEACLRP